MYLHLQLLGSCAMPPGLRAVAARTQTLNSQSVAPVVTTRSSVGWLQRLVTRPGGWGSSTRVLSVKGACRPVRVVALARSQNLRQHSEFPYAPEGISQAQGG